MKTIRRAAAIAISGIAMVVAPTMAEAQTGGRTPFTWQSNASIECVGMMCMQARFRLNLTGFGADLFGTPLNTVGATFTPGAASPTNPTGPISTPGFIRAWSISPLDGATLQFSSALNGTVQNGYLLSVTDGGRTLNGVRNESPFSASPIEILFTVTAPAGGVANIAFEYSGSAYLANNADYTWTANNGRRYDVGAFAGSTSVVPEPSTYALLATGLAGISLVVRRRRRA